MSNTSDNLTDALAELDEAARKSRIEVDAANVIKQAVTDLVMGRDAKAAYFAHITMKLKFEPDWSVDSACTNGKRVRYNPDFVAKLSRHKAVGLLAHEDCHITQVHHARRGNREPKMWNVAADLAINPMLRDAGFELPDGAVFPGEGEHKNIASGLSTEEFYQSLQEQEQEGDEGQQGKTGLGGGQAPGQPGGQADSDEADGEGEGDSSGEGDEQGEGKGQDPGKCGGVEEPGEGTPAECAQADAEARMMSAAALQSVADSGRGDLPGGMAQMVKQVLEPKTDWREVLRPFINSRARNDYSWQRPNRRFIGQGIILPGMRSEALGDVVLMLDWSGSITQEMRNIFAGEAQAILEPYDCKLWIIYHTSRVEKVREWSPSDGPLKLEDCPSGGTSHVPAFEEIEKLGIDPVCVICLTDLDTSFPPIAPAYPVLWCNYSKAKRQAPFGEVIKIYSAER